MSSSCECVASRMGTLSKILRSDLCFQALNFGPKFGSCFTFLLQHVTFQYIIWKLFFRWGLKRIKAKLPILICIHLLFVVSLHVVPHCKEMLIL